MNSELIYRNAFTEVYEILQFLGNEEINKIPKKIFDTISENRNNNYSYKIDKNKNLEEQQMMEETKAILYNIYRDYLATDIQRELIIEKQKNERNILEEEKKAKYNSNIIFKKNERVVEKNNVPIEAKKETFFEKIIKFFEKIFNKTK